MRAPRDHTGRTSLRRVFLFMLLTLVACDRGGPAPVPDYDAWRRAMKACRAGRSNASATVTIFLHIDGIQATGKTATIHVFFADDVEREVVLPPSGVVPHVSSSIHLVPEGINALDIHIMEPEASRTSVHSLQFDTRAGKHIMLMRHSDWSFSVIQSEAEPGFD